MQKRNILIAKTIVAGVLLFASSAWAAEPASPVTTVFGLPLGGAITKPIRVCSANEVGSSTLKTMCWVGPPSQYKGSKSGSIDLPDPNSRPMWAARAMFEIQINKKGVLKTIDVRTHSSDNAFDIENSIGKRFGLPTAISNNRPTRAVTWDKPELHIEMFCHPDIQCRVKFSTRQAEQERLNDILARKKVDDARPKTP